MVKQALSSAFFLPKHAPILKPRPVVRNKIGIEMCASRRVFSRLKAHESE